jgi:hypothetical protein
MKDKGEVENNFKGMKLIKNKSMAAKISDEGLSNVEKLTGYKNKKSEMMD